VHRKGTNVHQGKYYCDENENELLSHYYGKSHVPLELLKKEYARVMALPINELRKSSPLQPGIYSGESTPQKEFDFSRTRFFERPGFREPDVDEIIQSLDKEGRWLVKNGSTSNAYTEELMGDPESHQFSTVNVGDRTDTSPFRDTTDQLYISTSAYIRNMRQLIRFVEENK